MACSNSQWSRSLNVRQGKISKQKRIDCSASATSLWCAVPLRIATNTKLESVTGVRSIYICVGRRRLEGCISAAWSIGTAGYLLWTGWFHLDDAHFSEDQIPGPCDGGGVSHIPMLCNCLSGPNGFQSKENKTNKQIRWVTSSSPTGSWRLSLTEGMRSSRLMHFGRLPPSIMAASPGRRPFLPAPLSPPFLHLMALQ